MATTNSTATGTASLKIPHGRRQYVVRLRTIVAGMFVVPVLGLLAAAAYTNKAWFLRENTTAMLTAAISVLALMNVAEFLGRGRQEPGSDQASSSSDLVRELTGLWALLAMVAILVHIAIQSPSGTATPDDVSSQVAVFFMVTAFGTRLFQGVIRQLLSGYDTPVKPRLRFLASLIDLAVLSVAVGVLWTVAGAWADHWLGAIALALVVSVAWFTYLTRAKKGLGKRWWKLSVVKANGTQSEPFTPPGWWSAIRRAVAISLPLAVPAGVFHAEAVRNKPSATTLAVSYFSFVGVGLLLFVSQMARRDGRAFYDFVAGTVVVQMKSGEVPPESAKE